MKKLNSSQRSFLRSQAHHLESIVLIGKNGLSDGSIKMINKVLNAHELVKIKFRDYKDEKESIANQIALSSKCQVVGIIGNVAIIFRQNLDPNMRYFQLPE